MSINICNCPLGPPKNTCPFHSNPYYSHDGNAFTDTKVAQVKEKLHKEINILREALQVQLDSCSALGCGACNKGRKAMELTRDEV